MKGSLERDTWVCLSHPGGGEEQPQSAGPSLRNYRHSYTGPLSLLHVDLVSLGLLDLIEQASYGGAYLTFHLVNALSWAIMAQQSLPDPTKPHSAGPY